MPLVDTSFGIDTHTHLKNTFMGTTTIDDYHYGTTAAVAGGTTCLIDFVVPGRGQSLIEAHQDWVRKATPKINLILPSIWQLRGTAKAFWKKWQQLQTSLE